MRTQLLRSPLRPLALAGLLLGLTPSSQAFTIIVTTDPIVKKVSVGAPPADGPSQTSLGPRYSISDGSLACGIVFTSTAKNLVTGQTDTNGANDVFLYDCASDKVVALVSHNSGGLTAAANGTSDQPVISPDGSFVVFRSTATDIVAGGAGFAGQTNVFLYDVVNKTNTLVSHASGSLITAGNSNSRNGVISRASGRPLVAFESLANNLAVPDDNGVSDIFRFNSADSVVNIVSTPNGGLVQSNGGSINPVIDSSGNCVVFQSLATNLVSDQPAIDDTNGAADVFRWLFGGAGPPTILLSHEAGKPNVGRGAVTGDGASTEPSVSDDCKRFAFKSSAKNLAPGQAENNAGDDIFHERDAGDAVLASHVDGSPDKTGSDVSVSPILSRDGNWIAYVSRAIDLSPGQTDAAGTSDVFVYDIAGDKNTLASHAAGDPKKVASAQSFSPEISTDGRYVAFASDAKDIDPNQNDGNLARDIFLYNRLWNSAVVASRRFASIAITGDGRSIMPALSGDGYTVAFTSNSDDLIADDPETAGFDDVFFFRSLGRVNYASVRSTDSQNSLEWITPATNIVRMEAWVNFGTTCPTTYIAASAGIPLGLPAQVPSNESFLVTDPLAYAPGTDLCYSFFIERDDGPILGTDVPAKNVLAHTLDTSLGPIKWASNVANVAALAQVGIGAQNLIAVANDGGVYGVDRGPAGGFWSSGYWPFRTDTAPIQGRPGVLTLSVKGSTHTTFVGSQDSRVYAFDADRGARAGGALWYTAPVFPSSVQSGIAGMFTFFGGVGNHLLVGTGLTTGFGYFWALDPATGLQRTGSPFSGGLSSIGAINTTASVDYAKAQVYFASLEFPAGQPSVWCLKLTATGLGSSCWSQASPSGISGGAIERNGTVYVGDDTTNVWAFDASTGVSHWPSSFGLCGSGGIKSFVLADRQGTAKDLYYATTTGGLCAVTDQGASPISKWAISTATIPGPSAPILVRIGGVAYVYVGSSNGRLYQVEADNSAAIKFVLVRPGATIGAPAFDVRDNMIYVGSAAGAFYAVQAPLP